MKILLCIGCLTTGCSIPETKVYVCDSKNAIRYHYKATCRGLSNCRHAIISLSLKEARNRGKTLCKWED
ncbi:hypothetical protein D3H65_06280 [Paraflavitalea soli]|uniref:Uncharacterized protein n=1 Tax=Paraflavitalea soli TaxID=2315862 RepID=A0A3B7MWQ2_9BACT|nr:hypothetical protein D3H65_06280 [Paraflavitalea soli]